MLIGCPGCGKQFGLRFDPVIEKGALALAQDQLAAECPDHDGKTWEFRDQV